jgi:hypothetical protein
MPHAAGAIEHIAATWDDNGHVRTGGLLVITAAIVIVVLALAAIAIGDVLNVRGAGTSTREESDEADQLKFLREWNNQHGNDAA